MPFVFFSKSSLLLQPFLHYIDFICLQISNARIQTSFLSDICCDDRTPSGIRLRL